MLTLLRAPGRVHCSMSKSRREWFRFVTNKADSDTNKADSDTAEIHLYGDIGSTYFGDGVSAELFVSQLDELKDVSQLDVRINSSGGSAWDGLTIANAIMRHPATVTTYIDGLAASAASIVAVAGDKVITSKYAQMMLHNAHAVCAGTALDLREVADGLDQLNASMAIYYADRAGGTVADWANAMAAETWYSADEMLDAGLVTEIDDSTVREEVEKAAAHAMANTAEQFKYQGRTAAPPPAAAATNRKKEGRPMADKKTIAESLGLKADASDDDILAATRKALGIEGDDKPGDGDGGNSGDGGDAPKTDEKPIVDAPAEPVKELAGATAKAGETVELDRATYDQLMANSQMGAQAHATLQAQADARIVDAAIDRGKITPARRNHYLALMKSDRTDTTDLLTNRLAEGASVPLSEIGHSADVAAAQASVTDDPRFAAWKVG